MDHQGSFAARLFGPADRSDPNGPVAVLAGVPRAFGAFASCALVCAEGASQEQRDRRASGAQERRVMRVAIVQQRLETQRGGAETSTLEMAARLAEFDAQVTIVAADESPTDGRRTWACHSGVRVERVAVGGSTKLRRTIAYVRSVDSYCREQRFDIVHAIVPCFSANVYQPRSGLYPESLTQSTAMISPAPLRVARRWLRRFNYRQRFLMLVERAMLSDAHPPWVAAVSRYIHEQLARWFPAYPLERAPLILNGVEIDAGDVAQRAAWRRAVRAELKIADDAPLALFVGHNFKLKGLGELIDAIAARRAAAQRAWTLAVVGRGDPRPWRAKARRRGVTEAVRFLGARDDVRPMYAAADVLAHPTWFDPCSRVVLEALACGLPVVTTRFNGAADAIDDGKTGFVIDSPANIEALADAMRAALAPDVRETLAAKVEQIRERVSMRRHARELRALYERVLAEP
ncbi:MAG: glycosyltransferase family 1 protein [Planctomycetota bacterium]|nr:MAG: glycosyltransferase family 1 protein [Planctomycetota bacterium]